MGAKREAANDVPTGKVVGDVDAKDIFTVSAGLVGADGKLNEKGQVVKTTIKRGTMFPYLVGGLAILGAIVVIGTVVTLFRKRK